MSATRNPTQYSLREAGALLGVGYRHVRRLVQHGELRAKNIAKAGAKPRWVVTPQAVAAASRRRARKRRAK